ncbi:diguanylate cyclase [Rhizobium sp. 18065]|uniref:GGDEF domain-containing protein n=1 Tax=Rhizobium sp. 18065 TaxID=2681411 RepID=UPI00135A5495|nr:diguanylate cyclase [Rhizobium sp. 18065]
MQGLTWVGARQDWLLRMGAEVEAAHERAYGAMRIVHLRQTILVGLAVYNVYNLTSLYLMADIQSWTVFLRLCLLTPGSLLIFCLVPRLPADWREALLLPGVMLASLLPLFLLWLSQSPLATYTIGELPLALVFGNMLLVLRFRYAVPFTLITCGVAIAVVKTKVGIDPALHFPFLVQIVTGAFLTLYANWHVERVRCRSFLAEYDARRRADRAERLGDRLRDLSRTDTLTGIANRGHLDETLAGWLEDGSDVLVMMVDVDHFKPYNDLLGHPAGDECLKLVAQRLADYARYYDGFAARYGGEEFTLIFQMDAANGGSFLADRVVKAVRTLAIPHPARTDGLSVVTVSAGFAGTQAGLPRTAGTLLARADQALYEAKRQGRDRSRAA